MEWTTAALLVAATVTIALVGARATTRQTARTALCAAVALVAALAWFSTASGAEGLSTGSGTVPPFDVGWLLAAPLLLVVLSITAAPLPRVRAASGGGATWREGIGPLLAALLTAGVAMGASGMVAVVSTGTVAWAWLAARVALLAVVLFVLWGPLRDVSEDSHPLRAETYFRHAAILTVLLALYPVVQLFSPSLAGLAPEGAVRILHALLDLTMLGAFPLYVVLDDKRLAEIETQARPFPPVTPRAARGTP